MVKILKVLELPENMPPKAKTCQGKGWACDYAKFPGRSFIEKKGQRCMIFNTGLASCSTGSIRCNECLKAEKLCLSLKSLFK
jgi:hypothetical protein